jgi:hypothetical protein
VAVKILGRVIYDMSKLHSRKSEQNVKFGESPIPFSFEIWNLYSWPMTVSRRSTYGHVARVREIRNVYTLLVKKPEGKSPLGRFRRTLG